MYLAYETIKSYRKRIILKMEARSLIHCVGEAYRRGWL